MAVVARKQDHAAPGESGDDADVMAQHRDRADMGKSWTPIAGEGDRAVISAGERITALTEPGAKSVGAPRLAKTGEIPPPEIFPRDAQQNRALRKRLAGGSVRVGS